LVDLTSPSLESEHGTRPPNRVHRGCTRRWPGTSNLS